MWSIATLSLVIAVVVSVVFVAGAAVGALIAWFLCRYVHRSDPIDVLCRLLNRSVNAALIDPGQQLTRVNLEETTRTETAKAEAEAARAETQATRPVFRTGLSPAYAGGEPNGTGRMTGVRKPAPFADVNPAV